MKELRFTVEPHEAGTRLDQFVAARAPHFSRARAHQLIEEGHVTFASGDPRPVKAALRVRADAVVIVREPAPRAVELVPQDLDLQSLYEDKHLIVIDKPAGLTVHPGAGGEGATLVHGLLHRIADLRGIGGELRPGIVHRLDKDTSGCLVVAKSEAALQGLQAAFKAREVEKRYLAIAHGKLAESGELDTMYARHPVDRKRFSSKVKEGKRAVTRWRLLAESTSQVARNAEIGMQRNGPGASEAVGRTGPRTSTSTSTSTKTPTSTKTITKASTKTGRSANTPFASASVAEVFLLTGRTHQIRAHFADAGHPLLGDVLYGGAKRDGKLEEDSPVKQAAAAIGRQALHAWVLEFQHPITGAFVSCTSPIPPEFRAAFDLLGIDPAKIRSNPAGAEKRSKR